MSNVALVKTDPDGDGVWEAVNADNPLIVSMLPPETNSDPRYELFGRLRTAHMQTVWDAHFQCGLNASRWYTATSGGATVTAANARAQLATTGAVQSADLQSRRRIAGQPGKTSVFLVCGTLCDGAIGQGTSRIGVYTDANGVFIEYDEKKSPPLSIVFRTNSSGTPVDTLVPSTSWNKGAEVTIDPLNRAIFVFAHKWMGAGTVVVGVLQKNTFVALHEFDFNGSGTGSFWGSTALPVRAQISTSGPAGRSTNLMSAVAYIEGGYAPVGYTELRQRSQYAGEIDATDGLRVILALRVKLSAASCPITVIPTLVTVLQIESVVAGSDLSVWLLNGVTAGNVLTTGTWETSLSGNVEFNEYRLRANGSDATGSPANDQGGTFSFTASAARQLYASRVTDVDTYSFKYPSQYPISVDGAGNYDILCVVVDPIGDNNRDVSAAIEWSELS